MAAPATAVEEAAPSEATHEASGEDDLRMHPTNVSIREATAHKEAGSKLFSEAQYDQAVVEFLQGAEAAAKVEGNWRSQVARDLRTACLNNSALARIKQGRYEDAVSLCDQALAVDAKCVKALYRRASAHLAAKAFAAARSDLQKATELQPNNKEVKDKLVEAERAEMASHKASKGANDYSRFDSISVSDEEDTEAAAETPKPPTSPEAPRPAPPKAKHSPAPKAGPAPADKDGGDDGEVKPGKGYRYWSKDKCAPRVIPQKIDPSTVQQPAPEPTSGSVWNAAGTYEERDQTAWAREHLAGLLGAVRAEVPGGGSVTCGSPKDWEGDAGIHLVRGRKRYLWDLKLSLPFEADLPAADTVFKGELCVADFSSDDVADWEASVKWSERPRVGSDHDASLAAALGRSFQSAPDGTLFHGVRLALTTFIETFRAR